MFLAWISFVSYFSGTISGPLQILSKGQEPRAIVQSIIGAFVAFSLSSVWMQKKYAIAFTLYLIVAWIVVGFLVTNLIDW